MKKLITGLAAATFLASMGGAALAQDTGDRIEIDTRTNEYKRRVNA